VKADWLNGTFDLKDFKSMEIYNSIWNKGTTKKHLVADRL